MEFEANSWTVANTSAFDVHLQGNFDPVDQQLYSATFHPHHTTEMEVVPRQRIKGTSVDMVMQPGKPTVEPDADCKEKIKFTCPAIGLQVNAVVYSNNSSGVAADSHQLHLVLVQTLDKFSESRAYGVDRTSTSCDFYMNACGSLEKPNHARQLPILDIRTDDGDDDDDEPNLPYYSTNADTSFEVTEMLNDKCAVGKIFLSDTPYLYTPLAVNTALNPELCKFLSTNGIKGSVFYLKEVTTSLTLSSWLCFADSEKKLLYPTMKFERDIAYAIQATNPSNIAKEFEYRFINTQEKQRMPTFQRSHSLQFPEKALCLTKDGKLLVANSVNFTFAPSLQQAQCIAG